MYGQCVKICHKKIGPHGLSLDTPIKFVHKYMGFIIVIMLDVKTCVQCFVLMNIGSSEIKCNMCF